MTDVRQQLRDRREVLDHVLTLRAAHAPAWDTYESATTERR
jgi:hypothetical protein